MSVFGKAKALENEIEQFYDCLANSSLVFKAGIADYLKDGPECVMFKKRLEEIDKIEREADNLRRDIKYQLYSQMLIPESRGDVLGLLENSDNVIDKAKRVLHHFDVEQPQIPNFVHEDFIKLTDASSQAVDEMVKACRAFFREIKLVNDFINKVHFYEREADKLEDIIKKKVFGAENIDKFSRKIHLRYFVEKVANLSDSAENLCERLSVYAIKRAI